MCMQWMILPYKRMLDFRGRSRRLEYWMFTLGAILQIAIVTALFAAVHGFRDVETNQSNPGMVVVMILAMVLAFAYLWAHLAVAVRRFHDQDRSGWFYLLSFVPYGGSLILLVFMCLPGTAGPNRFGPDPINPDLTDVFG